MNLIEIFETFPTQQACIDYLESLRWGDNPCCPFCGADRVAAKAEKQKVGRWNCHECRSSFNVLSGTIFEKTRIPLQKWFCAISLMVHAKKSLSSYQLARDLRLTQPTAWYMQQRIRSAMTEPDRMLYGIVEADETYVGGKPRHMNEKADRKRHKRGRGTKKTAVVGAVERGGKVFACVAEKLTSVNLVDWLQSVVEEGSILFTDENRAYSGVEDYFPHGVVNHAERYADGAIHTNTIESFWALVKRAWFGSHHHYSVKYMPLFIAEATWKYNERKNPVAFGTFLRGLF